MLQDALLRLSNAQAVTASAVSIDKLDVGPQARDIGRGTPLYINTTVDVTVLAAGAATVQIDVITSALDTLASPTVLCSTGPIPKADLVAGRAPIVIAIAPSNLSTLPKGQQFMGVQYTVGTGPLTAGSFTTYVSNEDCGFTPAYSSGFTVV